MSMKKSLIYLFSALALASCGEAIEIPDVQEPTQKPTDNPETPVGGDMVFSATVEALSDGSQPGWESAASILLYDGVSVQTLTNTAESGIVARFPAKVAENTDGFTALYPALEGATLGKASASFDVPVNRTVSSVSTPVRVAKSTGSQLYFRNLLTEVRFTVAVEGADKVEFRTAGGEKVAGPVSVDYAGEDPVLTASSDAITFTGVFESGETYSFHVLSEAISGYSVVVWAGAEEKAHIVGDALDLTSGLPVELPAFTADVPTYQISHFWLWGGTGPEYDCTKVYDLFTKPGCFNDEDGRGITALQDNYLLFHPDGTFTNYAGADGRNWWFVYSGAQNPANGKDVDIRKFFDLLPLYEGSYSIEGSTCTFTKADGSTVTAEWVEAGSYAMPGTSPTLYVNIETEALRFTIEGGADNWDYSWQDYGVIACNPRVLYLELEKMPDGFVVPEESRTSDADFEYVAPVDPVDQFDWENFGGSWTVFGGNSAPYGISVLGGSGDDPAFVSPIDKSWDWNDSIWNESDNGLVITVSEKTETLITGSANWWAGEDGAFWDYVWKGTGEDLSRFYDQIPKGDHPFTLDLGTMTITLGNGHVARFLTPGTHEFVFGRTWEVPSGCFAFAFHLMDPIDGTGDRWTDVDRFVNAPLEYVIMFEKN